MPLESSVASSLEPPWKLGWSDGPVARLAVELFRDRLVPLGHLASVHTFRNLVFLVSGKTFLLKVTKLCIFLVKLLAGVLLVVRDVGELWLGQNATL